MNRSKSTRTLRPDRTILAVLAAALLASPGCLGVRARTSWVETSLRHHAEYRHARQPLSCPANALLGRIGMAHLADADPAEALDALQTLDPSWTSEPDAPLLMADLSYRAALRDNPARSLSRLQNAAVLASLALDDPRTSDPAAALELHNRALADLIRRAGIPPALARPPPEAGPHSRRLLPVHQPLPVLQAPGRV